MEMKSRRSGDEQTGVAKSELIRVDIEGYLFRPYLPDKDENNKVVGS